MIPKKKPEAEPQFVLPDDAIFFAKRLRQARQSREMSVTELSQLVGHHIVSVHNWENGRNLKNVMKFFNLCRALDVTPDYFFEK